MEVEIGSSGEPVDNESKDAPHEDGSPPVIDSWIITKGDLVQWIYLDLLDAITMDFVNEQHRDEHFANVEHSVANPRFTVKPQSKVYVLLSPKSNTKARVPCSDCGRSMTPGRIERHLQRCSLKVSASSRTVRQTIVYIIGLL